MPDIQVQLCCWNTYKMAPLKINLNLKFKLKKLHHHNMLVCSLRSPAGVHKAPVVLALSTPPQHELLCWEVDSATNTPHTTAGTLSIVINTILTFTMCILIDHIFIVPELVIAKITSSTNSGTKFSEIRLQVA